MSSMLDDLKYTFIEDLNWTERDTGLNLQNVRESMLYANDYSEMTVPFLAVNSMDYTNYDGLFDYFIRSFKKLVRVAELEPEYYSFLLDTILESDVPMQENKMFLYLGDVGSEYN
jgi:hypothetical protein